MDVSSTMQTKLIIYWSLYSMSGDVAKRGGQGVAKKYKVELKQSEFPEAINPEDAINGIMEVNGTRPDAPLHVAHHFAEIRHWAYLKRAPHESVPVEKWTEPNLFPIEELQECITEKEPF